MIENIGNIHRSTELLLFQLFFIMGWWLRNLALMWYFVHEVYITISHLLLVLWCRLVLLGSLIVEADLRTIERIDMFLLRVVLRGLGGPFNDLLLLIA